MDNALALCPICASLCGSFRYFQPPGAGRAGLGDGGFGQRRQWHVSLCAAVSVGGRDAAGAVRGVAAEIGPNQRFSFVRPPATAGAVCGQPGLRVFGLRTADLPGFRPAAFMAPLFALLAEIFLLFAITLVWQVSVHTATTAGLVTFACLAFGPIAACWTLLIPLVAWARIYLRRHTLAQTLAGAFLGSSCFLALFALRGIVW